MNALPPNSQERTFSPTRHNYALGNTQTGNASTNNIYSLNTNVANVSHSYNDTIYRDTLLTQVRVGKIYIRYKGFLKTV